MAMRPILFNTEMVRAILDGRKTATRRLVKPQPVCYGPNKAFDAHDGDFFLSAEKNRLRCRTCGHDPEYSREGSGIAHRWEPPFCAGDILYVRETWAHPSQTEIANGADPKKYLFKADDLPPCAWDKWNPSIHMPKEAARVFLRVKCVSVNQLQNITEADAIKEGVPDEWPMDPVYCPECKGEGLVGALHPATLGFMEIDCPYCEKAVTRFANLWNSTIKPADLPTYGWDANPWVWVIEYERISREGDG